MALFSPELSVAEDEDEGVDDEDPDEDPDEFPDPLPVHALSRSAMTRASESTFIAELVLRIILSPFRFVEFHILQSESKGIIIP